MTFPLIHRLFRPFRNLPIQRKLLLSSLLLISLVSALTGFLFYYKSGLTLRNKTEQYTQDILMETGNNIETKVREAERLSFQIISSEEIQEVLRGANRGFADEYSKVSAGKVIDSKLRMMASSDLDIAAIRVTALSGMAYDVNPASVPLSMGNEARLALENAQGSIVWFSADPSRQTISFGRMVNSLIHQQPIGYVMVTMHERSFFDIYKNTEVFKNGDLFLLHRNGSLLSSKDKTLLGQPKAMPVAFQPTPDNPAGFFTENRNGQNQYVSYRQLSSTGWNLVLEVPAFEYEKEITSLRHWALVIGLAAFLLAFVISVLLARTISRPVRQLSLMMRHVGEGNFAVSSHYDSEDEIGTLSRHFNNMVGQIHKLIQEVYQTQLLNQKAELKSLRMQINPHFLYNTLESINWMARIRGVPEVGTMVKALGDLMRTSLSGDDFLTLEEEIRNIRNYLTIQQLRYGDRLETHILIPEALYPLRVPRLILQPIVENALVHGIDQITGQGVITLRAFLENDAMILEVEDNGVGMAPGILESLLADTPADPGDDAAHIGLRNVHLRLHLYYGPACGVEAGNHPDTGTVIRLKLPGSAMSQG